MSTSPPRDQDLEFLLDGDWIPVSWSENAYDGSPHGIEGWADENGYYFPEADLEDWRYAPGALRFDGESDLQDQPMESPLRGHSLRQPIVVFGLGFGDESKGATVDFLCHALPDVSAVVRWSGGANAAHNVRHGPRHHTFRLFGSGTLLGVPTVLTEKVLVDLRMILAEAAELEAKGVYAPLDLLSADGRATVVTPILVVLNRAREILRGASRHGSCGLGVGETVAHRLAEAQGLQPGDLIGNFEVPGPTEFGEGVLQLNDFLRGEAHVERILQRQMEYSRELVERAKSFAPQLKEELELGEIGSMAKELSETAKLIRIISEPEEFERQLQELMDLGTVIFEGSQGLLLDEVWGFHPHTTWAQTEPVELHKWLYGFGKEPYLLGLTRTYMTRHGAGPLPSETRGFSLFRELPPDDNGWSRWQGDFRAGPLDLPLLGYSREILKRAGLKLSGISVSHLDAFGNAVPTVVSYGGKQNPAEDQIFIITLDSTMLALADSPKFLEEKIMDQETRVEELSSEELFQSLEVLFGCEVVLKADGPRRRDRKMLTNEAQKS